MGTALRIADADLPEIFFSANGVQECRDGDLAAAYKSPSYDAYYRVKRKRLKREFGEYARAAEHADLERRRWFDDYLNAPSMKTKRRSGDAALALPKFEHFEERVSSAVDWGAAPGRIEQARKLKELGVSKKANRLLLCGVLAMRVNCLSCEAFFLTRFVCSTRYCPECGELMFRELFHKYALLQPLADRVLASGKKRLVAKIDFTLPNTGEMPTREEIWSFRADLRSFWRMAERQFEMTPKDYGVIGCDELGGSKTEKHPLGNWNLHRHCGYVGPALPQRKKELSALWSVAGLRGTRRREMLRFIRNGGVDGKAYRAKLRKHGMWGANLSRVLRRRALRQAWVCGLEHSERRFVSIQKSSSFLKVVAHALKYPAKYLSKSTPERLAQLEKAFDGSRRVSARGVFYGASSKQEQGAGSDGSCPLCGGQLARSALGSGGGYVVASELVKEGRVDLFALRREKGREKVFSDGASP